MKCRVNEEVGGLENEDVGDSEQGGRRHGE